MVKIEAVVPTPALIPVCEVLEELRCGGMTVMDTRDGLEPAAGWEHFRGQRYHRLRASIRVEVVVPRRRIEEVLEMLARAVRESTGEEARLVTTPVTEVIRIRTGERGEDALSSGSPAL